ncbi:MAG TPA: hypothetical protein VF137_03520 [Candidatus Dormibacteraeota bacterium]
MHRWKAGAVGIAAGLIGAWPAGAAAGSSYISGFTTISTIASTVPKNGDVNPYGLFNVPVSRGRLVAGDALVSNFNDSGNLQGTGTTIVEVAPGGAVSQFARIPARAGQNRCPGGIGLTTALVVLRSGWVIVGSLPTSDGSSSTAQAGCLLVLDSSGAVVETFSGGDINGPWDMTVADMGATADLFVTNVLNGTVANSPSTVDGGTVVRIGLAMRAEKAPQMTSETVIGTGYPERTDPAALVVGPTGVGLAGDGTLYVADSADNAIAKIPNALTATSATGDNEITSGQDLNVPLGLTIAPNGDILTVNGGDGFLVETTPAGTQIDEHLLDSSGGPPSPGAGALFGIAVRPDNAGVLFVDDADNTLKQLT